MTPRERQGGFTLIEVVLAVALALALVGALLVFYQQTTQVRAAVGDVVETVADERIVMDLVTDELRAALVLPRTGITLEGSLDAMRFVTTRLPGAVAWAEPSATDAPAAPPERDVQIVGCRLRVVEDADGSPVIVGVEHTCQKLVTARAAEEGKEIQATLLAPRLKFLRLRYWDGTDWQPRWSGSGLPGAVEIVLGEKPLPEGTDALRYPYPIYRRVVFVPAGAKARSGTAVIGLGEEGGP